MSGDRTADKNMKNNDDDNDEHDLYAILGVDSKANASEIKRAYLRRAVALHPDKPTGDTAQFQRLGAAYAILKDAEKRAIYDSEGWSAELQEEWTEVAAGGSISERDIEEFRRSYQGSEEEIADLLRLYTDDSDVASIGELSERMFFGGIDEEARFRDILLAHVVAGLVPKREEIFVDEAPLARAKRLRAAQREAREAEQLAKELAEKKKIKKPTAAIASRGGGGGGGGGSQDLVAMIQSRNAARVSAFDAFEAKWAARANDDDEVIDFGVDDNQEEEEDDDDDDDRPRRVARRGGSSARGGARGNRRARGRKR
jgi:DnaJ family protein C protein 9